MRLIHCADLHIDSSMRTYLDEKLAKQRRTELLHNFSRLADEARKQQAGGILIAGDMFDTITVSSDAYNTVRRIIEANHDIAFFYLRGNHDEALRPSNPADIPENLITFTNHWKTYKLSDRVTLSGYELHGGEPAIAEGLKLEAEDINIVMLHGELCEYGREHFDPDQPDLIALPEFRNKNIDYLALGHIHSYEEGRLDARGSWCYPGCLEGRGFDECGRHGYVLIDIDEETGEVHREFEDFAKRRIFDLEADITGLENPYDMVEQVRTSIAQAGYGESTRTGLGMTLNELSEYGYVKHDQTAIRSEDMLRVTLTGQLDVTADLNLHFIEKSLAEEFYVFRLRDATSIKVDYHSFSHDESLKGEFVRLVEGSDITESMKAEIIRLGLASLQG